MWSEIRHTCLVAALIAAVPVTAVGEESRANGRDSAARAVAPAEKPESAGLLLPAVQKARPADEPASSTGAAPRRVQPAPQKGVEPDEIDAASRMKAQPRQPERAGSGRPPSPAASPGPSVQQMMLRLSPKQAALTPAASGAGASAGTSLQSKPQAPPKYEIADCGTATNPMICCHHEAGDGSSCNLFKMLCENAGGTAQGDGESAACSDW